MKRTTYILIGIFLANMVFAVMIIFYVRGFMVKSNDSEYQFTFTQSDKRLDLNDVHTFEFITKGADHNQFVFFQKAIIEIKSPDHADMPKILYPSSEYVSVNKEKGVLSVVLDLTSTNLKEDNSNNLQAIYLNELQIQIETDKMLKRISSDKGYSVVMHHVQLDSLHLESGNVRIGESNIRSLTLNNHLNFEAERSTFNDLHVDLDNVEWKMKENNVNTLFLTGSIKHTNEMSADQYRRLVWEPKNENAKLNVSLKGKAEVVVKN